MLLLRPLKKLHGERYLPRSSISLYTCNKTCPYAHPSPFCFIVVVSIRLRVCETTVYRMNVSTSLSAPQSGKSKFMLP